MSKTPISKQEVEGRIFAALRAKHPGLQLIGVVPDLSGRKCLVIQGGAGPGPVYEANAMLTDILAGHVIVDEHGRELDGKVRQR